MHSITLTIDEERWLNEAADQIMGLKPEVVLTAEHVDGLRAIADRFDLETASPGGAE